MSADKNWNWPAIVGGLAVAEQPRRVSRAEADAALAREEAAAPPRNHLNGGSVHYPFEAFWAELPREPSIAWEIYLGQRDGQLMMWIAHGNDVAELAIPQGDDYADARALVMRILADEGKLT